MLAPQFEDVANTGSATIDLLKICDFKGLVAKTYANRASASQITVYNPSTQLIHITITRQVTEEQDGELILPLLLH